LASAQTAATQPRAATPRSAAAPSQRARAQHAAAGQAASKVPRYERYSCTYVAAARRAACIAGKLAQYPRVGWITWYGEAFRGKRTTSGEVFNPDSLTAASRELPFGTQLRVTNLLNGRHVIVRINDRGPWRAKNLLDLSLASARRLRFVSRGRVRAYIEVLSPTPSETRLADLSSQPKTAAATEFGR
jgi:rare lipoprotein A